MRGWVRADWACLGVVLLVAAALRFHGLGYGLPRVVYVDAFMYVGEAGRILEPGDYVPHSFYYPSVFMDLLAGLYWLLDIETVYARHLAARAVSATFSLLLIALVYVVVRRAFSTRGAVIAAALTAVCPVLLTSARIEATDSALVLFMTATLALAGSFPARLRDWLLIGSLAGLAAGTKYTGGFVLVFVALAAAIVGWTTGSWKRHVVGATAALACAAVVFGATTPWLFEHLALYADSFETQMLVQRSGQIGRVQANAWDYFVSQTPTWEQPWLGTSFLGNFGPVLFVAALAAWAWAILGYGGTHRRYEALYVLVFLALTVGAGRLKAIRYVIPTLPVLFILVGSATDRMLGKLPRRWALERWGAPALLVLLAVYPAAASLRYVAMASAPMTNDLAHEWLATNVPPRSRVFFSPLFVDDLLDLPFQFVGIASAGHRQYRLPEDKGPSIERSPMFSAMLFEQMRQSGVQYIVLNSWFVDAFAPVPENLRFFPRSVASYEDFRQRLAASATLRWRVEGYGDGRLGPSIAVYQLE